MHELRADTVVTAPCGQPIIRQGEVGHEMYLLIHGTANVFIHSAVRQTLVRTLGRGDVFGEMGLIGHHERGRCHRQ